MKRCKECRDPIEDSRYDYCSACRRRIRQEEEEGEGDKNDDVLPSLRSSVRSEVQEV